MTPTAEDLFRAVQGTNPFLRNRVSEPSSSDADEPTIHGSEFTRMRQRIDAVRAHDNSTGILLVGAAGVGKSHLLGRIHRWAREERAATTVFLHNVLASPARMPRYVLHATVSALAGAPSSYCESELYGLLNRAVKASLSAGKKTAAPPIEVRLAALTELGKSADPKSRIMPALKTFVAQSQAAALDSDAEGASLSLATAAVDWLSGELIEDDLARAIGVTPQLEDDHAVCMVIDVLSRVARVSGQAFLLAIDQVDNLDEDKVIALSSFLQALLDRGKNLAVVVSGVKESMERFRETGTIPEAAWDRIAEHRVELTRLGHDEARRLVQRRVEQFATPFEKVRGVRALRSKDPFFPLGSGWLDRRLDGRIEVRARDVVTWARDAWDEQRARLEATGGTRWLAGWPGTPGAGSSKPPSGSEEERVDRLVTTKITEWVAQRELDPAALPPDADNLATLAQSLLGRCAGNALYTVADVSRAKKGAYDLRVSENVAKGRTIMSGVVFLAATHANEVTAALKRMLDDKAPPDHRYLVTDEERRPLKLGPKGRDLYGALVALEARRFLHLRLACRDHAELDAFEGVLRTARVGDLEIDDGHGGMRPLREEEVAGSLHRQSTFLRHHLLNHFLTEEPPADQPASSKKPAAIDRVRARETILGNLAWRLGLTTLELATIYVAIEPAGKKAIDTEHVRRQLVALADEMHKEGLLHATPQDDDRFLQLLPKRS